MQILKDLRSSLSKFLDIAEQTTDLNQIQSGFKNEVATAIVKNAGGVPGTLESLVDLKS